MSISTENKNRIVTYLLEIIAQGEEGAVRKTAESFDLTVASVYKYINTLIKDGKIVRTGRDKYGLVSEVRQVVLSRRRGELVSEETIYNKYVDPELTGLPENIVRMWSYIVNEMINNVIDHSQASRLAISVSRNVFETTVILADDGVGIFNKIKTAFHLESLSEAVAELFKGKVTTDAKNHSGEGIFFSSRMADEFAVISSGLIFTHNSFDEEKLIKIKDANKLFDFDKGTLFFIKISNRSKKTAKEVFDRFTDSDYAFAKTLIPVKDYFNGIPVSRSQAKRLCSGLEKFKTIEFDFSGLDMMGQGFADQVFRVFANEHPGLELTPLNMSEEVFKMFRHVTAER